MSRGLTPDQLGEMRELLERELTRLLRSIGITETATATVTLDQTAVGRLSRMDSLQSQALAKGLAEREQVRLAHLQEALKRMDDGSYGICTECGTPLDFGRLLVLPEAPNCAGCS